MVAWSPDGTTLATPCDDRKIYLWDAATGKRRVTLEGSYQLRLCVRPSTPPERCWPATAGTVGCGSGTPVLGRPVLSVTGAPA